MSISNSFDKRTARKVENRIAIMDAAETIVLEGGSKALTADTLAARSGVSRRTIFNHFASVEDAATQRLNEHFNRIFEALPPINNSSSHTLERELIDGVRGVFTADKLPEHLAPYMHMMYALQNFKMDPKDQECGEDYSCQAIFSATQRVMELAQRYYPDVDEMRSHIFAHILVVTIGSGVYSFFTENSADPAQLNNTERMQSYIERSLDYVENLISGAYA